MARLGPGRAISQLLSQWQAGLCWEKVLLDQEFKRRVGVELGGVIDPRSRKVEGKVLALAMQQVVQVPPWLRNH